MNLWTHYFIGYVRLKNKGQNRGIPIAIAYHPPNPLRPSMWCSSVVPGSFLTMHYMWNAAHHSLSSIKHVLYCCDPSWHWSQNEQALCTPSQLHCIHAIRWYILDGNTISTYICRAEYFDPAMVVGLIKKGVCSNMLCDTVPGVKVDVSPSDPNADVNSRA